jgi:autotransporter-associated beta strand protein
VNGSTGTTLAANSGQFNVTNQVTGTGNLILNNNTSTSDGITLNGGANNVGTITSSGTGVSAEAIAIYGVGSNVTGLIANDPGARFDIETGLTVNTAGTTLTIDPGAIWFRLGAGVSGTGNLIINDNSGMVGSGDALYVAGASVAINNSGAVILTGTGVAGVQFTDIGSNVTGITQNGNAALQVTGTFVVNSGTTTLTTTTAAGIPLTTQLVGTGNLVLDNNSATANAITLGGGANNSGTIANSGTGTGSTLISGTIGANVTGVTQSSTTSALILSGNNTYAGATAVNGGILILSNTAAKSPSTTITVAAGAILDLGVGGTGFFSQANVDSLFANTLSGVSMNAAAGVGIDTSAENFTYATNQSASRSLTKTGGNTLILTGSNTYTGATNVAAGILQIGNGGTTGSIGGTSGVSVASGATLFFDRTDNYGGSFTPVISGAGSLSLSVGALTLPGANTYTGTTKVAGGVLIVSGSLAGTSSASVTSGTMEVDGLIDQSATTTITSPATLDGMGSVGAITANGGTIAPGLTNGSTAAGVLTAGGAVMLSSTTNFDIRLGLSASGTDNDQLAVTGPQVVTLSGTLNLSLGGGMANLTAGNVDNLYYVIINGGASGSIADTFTNLPTSGSSITTNGYTFDIYYDANSNNTASGNDVVLELTAIPEPRSWAMILAGFGMLSGIQRLRRNRVGTRLGTQPIERCRCAVWNGAAASF